VTGQPDAVANKAWRKVIDYFSPEIAREAGCVLFVFALAATMLRPVFHGDWPVGHDHPVHLFRIWQLRETLLHHPLVPWTWSHRWFAGYPENVVYPVGADFFVLAIQALSFGTLSLGRAYGIAFLTFYFLYGYAAFFFVQRAVQSRIAGLLAALFLLTDPGSNDIGGWFWIVDVGVWTSALGMVPALIGTIRMADLLENPKPRTAAAVGLCFGLSLLCHQIHLIYFVIAIPVLCLSRYLSDVETDWRRALPLLFIGLASGALIASYWLVPYLAALPFAAEVGGRGSDLSKISDALAGGTFFSRMHPIAAAFGLVGAICLFRARRPLPLFMALFIFVVIVGSSSSVAALFGPMLEQWVRTHIITERLLLLVKPFWYGAAAFLIVNSWRVVDRFRSGSRDDPSAASSEVRRAWIKGAVILALFSLFVAPILGRALAVFYRNEIRRPTIWHSERRDDNARKKFVTWAKREMPSGDFFRIAHGFDYDDHDLTDLGMELPHPFYKIWHMPTGHFKYDIGWNTNEALRATNVRYGLFKHPLTDRPDFSLVKVFDQQLWLYQFRDWNPVPFVVRGSGTLQLLRFTDEEILLRADSTASGYFRLNVSYFPKWHATRDNVAVPISVVSLPGVKNSGFMEVPLAPGTYRFHFERTLSDYAGTVLCLLGVVLCLLLGNWKRCAALFRWPAGNPRSAPLKGPPAASEEGGKEREKQERPGGDDEIPETISA
jgi:hypothetical protein